MKKYLGAMALSLMAFTTLISPLAAHDYKAGTLHIDHPWSRPMPATAKVGAGYLTIINHGTQDDTLLSAETPLAGRVEIHEMTMEGGIMKMRPLTQGLPLKAGEKSELKPGGYHIMFMDVKERPAVGSEFKATLVFARAGRVDVTFKVEQKPDTSGHGAHHKH
jgi:copper(I)-binding protein